MHIPDGFLDPKISGSMMGAAAVVLAYSFAKVKAAVTAVVPQEAFATAGKAAGNIIGEGRRALTKIGEKKIYLMGMVASIIFTAQMFDFTIYSGTSGHLVGGAFASVLMGPFAGIIVMSAVLAVQAFFFADGGIIALGANIINIAVLGAFLSYYIYFFLKKYLLPEWASIGVAAWLSVVIPVSAIAYETGVSLESMLKIHIVIGLAEAIITIAAVNILRKILPIDQEE